MKKMIALVGVMAFSTFAFTRMEASDRVELKSILDCQAAKIAELESELECYEAFSSERKP